LRRTEPHSNYKTDVIDIPRFNNIRFTLINSELHEIWSVDTRKIVKIVRQM